MKHIKRLGTLILTVILTITFLSINTITSVITSYAETNSPNAAVILTKTRDIPITDQKAEFPYLFPVYKKLEPKTTDKATDTYYLNEKGIIAEELKKDIDDIYVYTHIKIDFEIDGKPGVKLKRKYENKGKTPNKYIITNDEFPKELTKDKAKKKAYEANKNRLDYIRNIVKLKLGSTDIPIPYEVNAINIVENSGKKYIKSIEIVPVLKDNDINNIASESCDPSSTPGTPSGGSSTGGASGTSPDPGATSTTPGSSTPTPDPGATSTTPAPGTPSGGASGSGTSSGGGTGTTGGAGTGTTGAPVNNNYKGKLNIKNIKRLEPNTKYRIELYFSNVENGGSDKNIEFTTEKIPELINIESTITQGDYLDSGVKLRFSRPVQGVKNIDFPELEGDEDYSEMFILDKKTSKGKENILLSPGQVERDALDKRVITITPSTPLSEGEYVLTMKPNTIRRMVLNEEIKDTNPYNLNPGQEMPIFIKNFQYKEFSVKNISKEKEEEDKRLEREKIEEEKLKRQQEEMEDFKWEIADLLADELEKRFREEYGTSSKYLSVNDYMKSVYKDRYGEYYRGRGYIQSFLVAEGYIDDYIYKYGKDYSYIVDYVNRYGGFAYPREDTRGNPVFTTPFNKPTNKAGYHDYYDYYDYGYRYPVVRQGDDMKSQKTYEEEARLASKERELIARERDMYKRGYSSPMTDPYIPNNDINKKITIKVGSPILTKYENNQAISVNMGSPAYIANGRTMVSLSPVASSIGAWVNYDQNTKKTTVSKNSTIIVFTPNTRQCTINGRPSTMDAAPLVSANGLVVSLNSLLNSLGLRNGSDFYYDANTRNIVIRNY